MLKMIKKAEALKKSIFYRCIVREYPLPKATDLGELVYWTELIWKGACIMRRDV